MLSHIDIADYYDLPHDHFRALFPPLTSQGKIRPSSNTPDQDKSPVVTDQLDHASRDSSQIKNQSPRS